VLSHIPVEYYNFRKKAIYICHMMRQIILVSNKPETIDDKDYYGNKRIELYGIVFRFVSYCFVWFCLFFCFFRPNEISRVSAGQLVSLLFEDLLKRFNFEIQKRVDAVLAKVNSTEVSPF
jgi:DNA-directed RNA polymerase III subunit RPC2